MIYRLLLRLCPGLLEKSDFFHIGTEMTPAQLGVMYKTWHHNFKYGIKKFMIKTGGIPLGEMERYARRRGPEHERVIEKIKVKYL